MRKIAVFFILSLLVAGLGSAQAGGKTNRVIIASGQTVHGIGGSSVYIVDLHSPAHEAVVEGDCAAGFSGVTCGYEQSGGTVFALSGATINVQFAEIFHLNLGVNRAAVLAEVLLDGSVVAAKLNWQNISNMTNLAHDSGNTDYAYDFQPIKSPYLGLRVTSGATSMAYTLYLDMD